MARFLKKNYFDLKEFDNLKRWYCNEEHLEVVPVRKWGKRNFCAYSIRKSVSLFSGEKNLNFHIFHFHYIHKKQWLKKICMKKYELSFKYIINFFLFSDSCSLFNKVSSQRSSPDNYKSNASDFNTGSTLKAINIKTVSV